MSRRPYVFIGSSSEGLDVAKAVQANLNYRCETQIWAQGLFGLSQGTLETLVKSVDRFDFAVLALTPDDLTESRNSQQASPRDNVLFELGLFISGLGRERVFMVVDRSANLKLPSDLAGVTPAWYERPTLASLQSALGHACTQIEEEIAKNELRLGTSVSPMAQFSGRWEGWYRETDEKAFKPTAHEIQLNGDEISAIGYGDRNESKSICAYAETVKHGKIRLIWTYDSKTFIDSCGSIPDHTGTHIAEFGMDEQGNKIMKGKYFNDREQQTNRIGAGGTFHCRWVSHDLKNSVFFDEHEDTWPLPKPKDLEEV